jgi:hypothetical protein
MRFPAAYMQPEDFEKGRIVRGAWQAKGSKGTG